MEEKKVPDLNHLDDTVNGAYTTESIVSNSYVDENISTEEQNTVEIKRLRDIFDD